MKVFNKSSFEKFSINPIQISDLSNIDNTSIDISLSQVRNLETNPKNYIFDKNQIDLKPGYLIKTIHRNSIDTPSVWIYFDYEHTKKIFPKYESCPNGFYKYGAFVRYNKYASGHVSYLTFINYFDSWPNHKELEEFNINSIYQTNIDLDIFNTKQDIIDFYMENKLYEL